MEASLKLKKATQHLWTFTISKLISTFGASVYTFGISFYILSFTGSATSFATNLICSVLPRTIIGPFAGYAADKYSKKMIVIVAQIASILAMGGLVIVTMTSGITLTAIYVTTVILSITSSFSGVSFTSAIANLIDEGRIQKAMSYNQMSISIATIGGPAAGGLMYGLVSLEAFLLVHLVAYILAVGLEATMNFRLYTKIIESAVSEVKESMLQNMKAGITYIRKHQILSIVIWVSLLLNFLFAAFQVGFAFMLIDKLEIKSVHFGFTEGAFSVGMLLMAFILSIRKQFRFPLHISKWSLIANSILFSATTIPLFVPMSYNIMVGFYLTLMLLLGLTIILINTPMGVLFQQTIDEAFKGRVFGLLETISMGLMPLGMVLFGYLFDAFSPQWIMLSCGLLLLATVLYFLRPSVIRKAHPEIVEKSSETNSVSPAVLSK
ncbi:MFS transporter [Paenisporosarcina sp. TG20]|uniref:MFS transporter n=1 Tax=Paenisporosarcina sp. TG20 TaxID=1211706 RepID=UPI0002E42FAE|nr:MFS transporter [Paenisporosarcina sp. TG20]